MKFRKDITDEFWDEYMRHVKLLPKEEQKLVLFWLIMDEAAFAGIFLALITFYRSFVLDLFTCDIRDPFSLLERWLLWPMIGVIFATFGTTFATKYFSKRCPQPKIRRKVDQLIGSRKISILLWLVLVALLLPAVLEEYVYRGSRMVSLTKWLAIRMVVVMSSAFLILLLRESCNPEIVPLHPAKVVSYRRARSYRARRKRKRNKLVGKQVADTGDFRDGVDGVRKFINSKDI